MVPYVASGGTVNTRTWCGERWGGALNSSCHISAPHAARSRLRTRSFFATVSQANRLAVTLGFGIYLLCEDQRGGPWLHH